MRLGQLSTTWIIRPFALNGLCHPPVVTLAASTVRVKDGDVVALGIGVRSIDDGLTVTPQPLGNIQESAIPSCNGITLRLHISVYRVRLSGHANRQPFLWSHA